MHQHASLFSPSLKVCVDVKHHVYLLTYLFSPSLKVCVDVKHHVYLLTYLFSPSLKVCVDVKHQGRRRLFASELRSCVEDEVDVLDSRP